MKYLLVFILFPCLCYSQHKTDSGQRSKDEMYAEKEIVAAQIHPGVAFKVTLYFPIKKWLTNMQK